jgi:hypothetical protein
MQVSSVLQLSTLFAITPGIPPASFRHGR